MVSHPKAVGNLEPLHETVITAEEEEGRRNLWQGRRMAHSFVTFTAVQEDKYQNQASGCCTRSHNNQR